MTDLASLLLQQEKLAVLGIADPRLAPSWGSSASLDGTTLGVSNASTAPFAGFVQSTTLVTLVDKDDTNVDGGTVVEMHPAAYLALARLYLRLQDGSSTTLLRPVPRYACLTGGSGLPTGSVRPGDTLGSGAAMTFHDARGLFIDAGAVAACFAALMTLLPGLNTGSSSDLTSGLQALAGTSTMITVLASTPQGTRWTAPDSGHGVTVSSGSSGTPQQLGSDPVTLTDRTNATIHIEDSTALVRAGLYPSGALGTADVALPALPSGVTLARDFFRVVCVDLGTYLPGSRSSGDVDSHTAAEPAPTVRDGIAVTALLDGIDTLHAVSAVIADAGSAGEAFLVSPDIVTTRLPGAGSTTISSDEMHWPTHPAFPSPPFEPWSDTGTAALRQDGAVSATWAEAGSNDVLVTVTAGALPAGAFVRVFPRRMVFPDTLAAGPSIVRGDGMSTIAPDDSDSCVLRLPDPLALGTQSRPSGANVNFDLLIVPRPDSGPPRPRLLGGFAVPISDPSGSPPSPTAPTDFDETDGFATVPVANRGVCHAGVLGFPRADPLSALNWPSSGSASDIASFLIGLAESLGDEGSSTAPRDAPRMPTMARRETLVASRSGGTSQTWHAVVSGGWLTPRSRTAAPRLGNPGWPAEGEYDTTAVTVDGQLGYDVARAALRRSRGLVGRMTALNDDTGWGEPSAGSGRWAGAVLQSVAAYCETPDLALVPDPSSLPDGTSTSSWSSVVGALPSSVQSALTGVLPTKPRAFAEIRREAFAAKFGRRDAQVALKRAIGEARELVYIEAPRFGASAHTDGAPQTDSGTEDSDAEWDIVEALTARLLAAPALRVVVAVPKLPDLPPQYESFALLEYQSRQAALTALTAAGSDQVTVLHPVGFPGRPLRTGTTVVIVDDVWMLLGTSSPTRRGLTFDGSVDVALFDRQLDEGYSAGIRQLRRSLMARHLGATAPTSGQTSAPAWVRLARPAPAATLFAEFVNQEAGNGLVEPLYTPTPSTVTAAAASLADPDGRNVSLLVLTGADAINNLEMLPSS